MLGLVTVHLAHVEIQDRADQLFAELSWAEGAARRRCRDEIVLLFLPAAYRIAYRYAQRGVPVEDLRQVCAVGLVKAVDRFDPSYGSPFLGYAFPTITGEVKRHFRDHGWALKVSRRDKDLGQDASAMEATLMQELGRTPSIDELATRMELAPDDVRAVLDARRAYTVTSIDALASQHGVNHVEDLVEGTYPSFEAVDDRHTLEPALATLPEREQRILAWRYVTGLTQSEVAQRLGISQMHVSRLQARALSQLRRALEAPTGNPRGLTTAVAS